MKKAMTNESLPIINRFYQEFQVPFGIPIIMTDFSISRKHSMDHIVMDGWRYHRTRYSNKRDWYHLVLQNKKDKRK